MDANVLYLMFIKLHILPHVFYELPVWEQAVIYAFVDVYLQNKKAEMKKLKSK